MPTQINALALHPDFPEKVWVVVEQPSQEPYRLKYDPVTGTFSRLTIISLTYERGFSGAYGWIGGLGIPPEPHFDVLLVTRQNPQPGDILEAYICGVFFRADNDHKFVALDPELKGSVVRADLDALDPETQAELKRLYPRIGENEGWFDAETACSFLRENQPVHD